MFSTAAMEGAFNSPQRKTALVFLRLGIGFALLLTNPNTGYTGFQDIVMKVVVEGVQLADATWSSALDYIHNGGTIFVNNNAGKLTDSDVSDLFMDLGDVGTGVSNSAGPIQNLYLDEVCMDLSNQFVAQNPTDSAVASALHHPYRMVLGDDNKTIDFSGYGDISPYGSSNMNCGTAVASIGNAAKNTALDTDELQRLSFYALVQADQNLKNYYDNNYNGDSKTTQYGAITAASGGDLSNPDFDSGGAVMGAVEGGLDKVAAAFFALEQQTDKGFYDPLFFMYTLGQACLNAAGHIWADGPTAIGLSAAAAGICTSISPGATIINQMMSWMQPMYIMSGLGLFVAGFMLTFYAPLYPFLLFTFGAIGWIISVMESMVALGMTHPEGHDFLGKAEQALMLLLGVFIRPVLMVIGFLGGLILSYVSFSIANYGFSQVLAAVFHNASSVNFTPSKNISVMNAVWGVVTGDGSGNTSQGSFFSGHDVTDMLILPLLLVFYGFIVIELVNQSFSMIHVLPDMVLRWIGGPVQQDRSEQTVQKIGSQVGGAAKQVGEIGGSAQAHMGGAAGSTAGDSVGMGVSTQRMLAANSGGQE